MECSYKFRLYPNKIQREQIQRTFGCCRFVWNYFLALRQDVYKQTGKTLSYVSCANSLTQLKKNLLWLKDVDSKALQSSLRDLDTAYQNFFRRIKQGKKNGYPKFKSKHNHYQSFKSQCTNANIKVFDNAIQLPKLGRIKCRVSRPVDGRILSATVIQTPSDKYFVSLCCTGVTTEPLLKTGAVVGIDMGLKTYIVTSDGVMYPNHKYLAKSQRKLSRLNHQLSRKSKGSKRFEKARIKLARQFEHVTNQRQDSLQKLSTELIQTYDIISIEDLKLQNMAKNHHLAKAVLDAAWRELRRQLEYKAKMYDKQVVVVDRYFPSSQLCSNCGTKWQGTKNLAVRKWTCPVCGAIHDRDINAAKNILNEGLRLTHMVGQGMPEPIRSGRPRKSLDSKATVSELRILQS